MAHVRSEQLRARFEIRHAVARAKKVTRHTHSIVETLVLNHAKVGATQIFFSAFEVNTVFRQSCARELSAFTLAMVIHHYLLKIFAHLYVR